MDKDRDFITEFINRYKSETVLWNVSDPEYYNQVKKQVAYLRLLNFYRTVMPNAEMEHVKKKIGNLRCSVRRAKRNWEVHSNGNTNPDPPLWYYNLLEFCITEPKEEDEFAMLGPILESNKNNYRNNAIDGQHDLSNLNDLISELGALGGDQYRHAHRLFNQVIAYAKMGGLTCETDII